MFIFSIIDYLFNESITKIYFIIHQLVSAFQMSKIIRKKLITKMFKQPKIRLGNKSYSEDELQHLRKRNTQRYNREVRHNAYNTEYTTFYNSTAWKKARKQVLLRDNYMCQHCLAKGVVNDEDLIVHHKIELKQDWSKRLDMENLEAVCISCHNKIPISK